MGGETTSMLEAVLRRLAAVPADRLTTALDLPATRGRVSAVLATYNRCPFPPAAGRLRDNPLSWALDTLLGQAGRVLAEIVVVDDGSTDHTAAVLAHYASARTTVPVRVIHRAAHGGPCAARNDAIDGRPGAGCSSATTTASSDATTRPAPPTPSPG
jgi:hypothetical protein